MREEKERGKQIKRETEREKEREREEIYGMGDFSSSGIPLIN